MKPNPEGSYHGAASSVTAPLPDLPASRKEMYRPGATSPRANAPHRPPPPSHTPPVYPPPPIRERLYDSPPTMDARQYLTKKEVRFFSFTLGPVLFFILFIGLLAAAFLPFSPIMPQQLLPAREVLLLVPVVLGVVFTTRAEGPDFSLLAVLSISAQIFHTSGNLLLALSIGIVTGLLCALLITVFHLPSVSSGLLCLALWNLPVAEILASLGLSLKNGVEGLYPALLSEWFIMPATVLILVIFCFLFIFLAPPGHGFSMRIRQPYRFQPSYFLCYPLAGLFASMAGVLQVMETWQPQGHEMELEPLMGSTLEHSLLLTLFLWSVLSCSRLMDNRSLPLPAGILAFVLYHAIAQNGVVVGLTSMGTTLVLCGICLLFSVCAGLVTIANRKIARRLLPGSEKTYRPKGGSSVSPPKVTRKGRRT